MKILITVPKNDSSGPSKGALQLKILLSHVYEVDLLYSSSDKIYYKNYDCIISMCLSSDVKNILFNMFSRRKSIVSLRSCIYQDYRYLFGMPGIIFAVIHEFFILFSNKIVVMHNDMACDLKLNLINKNIIEIPNFTILNSQVSLINDKENNNSNKKKVIYCGSFSHRKNIFELLSLVENLKKYDVKLHMYGDGPLRNEFIELIGDNIKHFVFHGNVSNPYNEYNESDIFVLPSLHEGMSRAMLEAIQKKCFVITRNIGSAVDVINENIGGTYKTTRELNMLLEKFLILKIDHMTYKVKDKYKLSNIRNLWIKIINEK